MSYLHSNWRDVSVSTASSEEIIAHPREFSNNLTILLRTQMARLLHTMNLDRCFSGLATFPEIHLISREGQEWWDEHLVRFQSEKKKISFFK